MNVRTKSTSSIYVCRWERDFTVQCLETCVKSIAATTAGVSLLAGERTF